MQFTPLLVAAGGLFAAMTLAWAIQQRTGRSGWIDTIWSIATGAAALTVIALADDGQMWRRVTAGILVALWSLRLAGHIGMRTAGAEDDPRYAALMEEWGRAAPARLFRFLQIQALASFVLVLSVYAAVLNPAPFPGMLDFAAIAIALVALAGEAIADAQLTAFRRAAHGRKAVCDIGLWRWSRHPNYFFEWLWWVAWPALAFSGLGGGLVAVLSLLAPAMMYWLLVHVSGIPPLEQHMLASRGRAFSTYQAQVNAFFPGPRQAPSVKGHNAVAD